MASLHLLIILPEPVNAIDYHGRASIGGYFSKERFNDVSANGTTSNDSAVGSARFYFDASKISSKKLRFVTDVRNENDAFGQLDQEELQLSSRYTLQLRQLNLQYPNHFGGIYGSFGRFQAFNSGVVYVDGLELGFHFTSKLKGGIFGGQNPKSDQAYELQWSNSRPIFGSFVIYQDSEASWYRHTYSSTAIIRMKDDAISEETVEVEQTGLGGGTGPLLRSFIYNNTVLQFNRNNRLLTWIYYDVEPKPDLQNLWMSYYTMFAKKASLLLSVLDIHANEYREIQSIREELEPSSYQEAKAKLSLYLIPNGVLLANILTGKRTLDGLKRKEYSLGIEMARFINHRISAHLIGGVREKFTNKDKFLKLGIGYYSRNVEVAADYEMAVENKMDGDVLHPKILELSLGLIASKKFFTTIVAQRITDERVNITSALFRITSRFGNKDIPPIRDGGPPRGSL
ncbi:MAG: hypothetical protein R3B45_17865 [Bdellovibrionota bacterium]